MNRTLPAFHRTILCTACLLAFSVPSVNAQQDPGAVNRTIEQDLKRVPLRAPAAEPRQDRPERLTVQSEADIANLTQVNVVVPTQLQLLAQEIQRYWADRLNSTVKGTELAQFKGWLWEKVQSQGYLGYISTQVQDNAGANILVVTISAPQIGQVTIVAADEKLRSSYADRVTNRLAEKVIAGDLLDIKQLEAQLNAISYDLPVDLAARLRQVDSKTVDVVVEMQGRATVSWSKTDALVQVNNHGLSAYGRAQVLGLVTVAGHIPSSELTAMAQVSEGVQYLRSDYSAPVEGTMSRLKVGANAVESKSALTNNRSSEVGIGWVTLLDASREGTWQSTADVLTRQSKGLVSGLTQRSRSDQQLRLGVSSNHRLQAIDALRTSLTWTRGKLSINGDDLAASSDSTSYRLGGGYSKLEHDGSAQWSLSSDGRWVATTRWRLQWANKNLDSFNQTSLGGPNGVRAFGTDEGVGDQGGQASLDLIHYIYPSAWVGVIYDYGRVVPHISPQASDLTTSYNLKGAGLVLGGQIGKTTSWNATMSKSLGHRPTTPNAIRSEMGDWRGWVSVTQRF